MNMRGTTPPPPLDPPAPLGQRHSSGSGGVAGGDEDDVCRPSVLAACLGPSLEQLGRRHRCRGESEADCGSKPVVVVVHSAVDGSIRLHPPHIKVKVVFPGITDAPVEL